MSDIKSLRDFMFRGLLFEAEAERFRRGGVRIGADISDTERDLLDETLDPFGIDLRNEALQMMRVYALMYCFENTVRGLVKSRLLENHGDDWWNLKVPKKVRDNAESRRTSAENDTWLEGHKRDLLGFVDFGQLTDTIVLNWSDFSDLIPTQHWLKQRMDELEKARNFIAHNRLLLPAEFQRIEMYVRDWNRAVGL